MPATTVPLLVTRPLALGNSRPMLMLFTGTWTFQNAPPVAEQTGAEPPAASSTLPAAVIDVPVWTSSDVASSIRVSARATGSL